MNVRPDHDACVSRVSKVEEIPDSVRYHVTLPETDYVDLFTLETGSHDRSAEQWARAVLELAPLSRRNARRLWRLMGLRLGPPRSPEHVQGWKIAESGENWIRLETYSWYLSAQVICLVDGGRVSVSLSLRYDQRLVASVVWAAVRPSHQRAVPVMLHQAARMMAAAPSRAGVDGRRTGDGENGDGDDGDNEAHED